MSSKMRKMLSKTTSSGETAFPWKLHMVLEESVFGGFDDIISWIGDNAFKVHDPIQFEESVMRQFFNQTQYKSFQRQLNIYGFTRVKTAGKATGSYTHPLFVRGNPDACSFMVRVKVKKKGIRKSLNHSGGKSNRCDPIKRSHSFDKFTRSNKNALSPLLQDRPKSPTKKLMIEPTPLRSVSPSSLNESSMSNDNIEPTPIRYGSTTARNTSSMAMHTNLIPCENRQVSVQVHPMKLLSLRTAGMVPLSYDPQEQKQHYSRQPIRKLYNNVELDLDTIFDDDGGSNRCNPRAADNIVFDHNFHMVEESFF